jgi:hypothetical protein
MERLWQRLCFPPPEAPVPRGVGFDIIPGRVDIDSPAVPPHHIGEGRYPRLFAYVRLFACVSEDVDGGPAPAMTLNGACHWVNLSAGWYQTQRADPADAGHTTRTIAP